MLIFFSWWCVPSRHVDNIRAKFEHQTSGFSFGLFSNLFSRENVVINKVSTLSFCSLNFIVWLLCRRSRPITNRSVGFRQKYSSVSLWRELVEPVMPALLADPSPSLPLKIPLKAFSRHQTSQGPEYAQWPESISYLLSVAVNYEILVVTQTWLFMKKGLFTAWMRNSASFFSYEPFSEYLTDKSANIIVST